MTSPSTGLLIGSGGLRQLHRSLLQHAPDAAITVLQEAGYAAGEGVHQALRTWLGAHAGTDHPEELDATQFGGALSDFFQSSGWGQLSVKPVGGAALAFDSADWIEAEPGSTQMPMCFFTSGMLADLLGRVSGEQVAVMEVECRSQGDSLCRFLSASPATLQEVYEKMTSGMSYAEALGAEPSLQ
jgi:predicted hydrocarbon binding protein